MRDDKKEIKSPAEVMSWSKKWLGGKLACSLHQRIQIYWENPGPIYGM